MSQTECKHANVCMEVRWQNCGAHSLLSLQASRIEVMSSVWEKSAFAISSVNAIIQCLSSVTSWEGTVILRARLAHAHIYKIWTRLCHSLHCVGEIWADSPMCMGLCMLVVPCKETSIFYMLNKISTKLPQACILFLFISINNFENELVLEKESRNYIVGAPS